MSLKVHLITSWYRDPDDARRLELVQAISANQRQKQVIHTTVLAQDQYYPHGEMTVHRFDRRPTFADLVACGRDEPDTVNLLVNADCYIHPDDMALLEKLPANAVWCISRQDNVLNCSQDAWAWRGKLELPDATYCQGELGCDNRAAYDCAMAGRIPVNPSLSIRLMHVHASGVRRYSEDDRIPKPYLFVEPCRIGDNSVLAFDGTDEDRARLQTALEATARTVSEPVDCIAVCLGRAGDILNILPACRHLGIRHMLIGQQYQHALMGQSYIRGILWPGSIEDLESAVGWAKSHAKTVLVPQLFGTRQPKGLPPRTRPSFVQDQWDRLQAGLGDYWGTLPLVFDARDRNRERDLILHAVNQWASKRLLLVNTAGATAPYPWTGGLLRHLREKWSSQFEILDLAYIRTAGLCDLLALYEIAAGLITADTASLHLSRACPQLPVFQFVRSGPDATPIIRRFGQPYEVEDEWGAVDEFCRGLRTHAQACGME